MYSLRDDSDSDAWADYRTTATRHTTPQNNRYLATETEEHEPKGNTDPFDVFFKQFLETSTKVDVRDLCDRPPHWDKLPDCPVCASGRKLDVLHLARSCLCSPFPCEGHTCACSEKNVTPACL